MKASCGSGWIRKNRQFLGTKIDLFTQKQQAETCAAVDIRTVNVVKFTN